MFQRLCEASEIVCKIVCSFALFRGAESTVFISLNKAQDSQNLRLTMSRDELWGERQKVNEINFKLKQTQIFANLKTKLGPGSQWRHARTES